MSPGENKEVLPLSGPTAISKARTSKHFTYNSSATIVFIGMPPSVACPVTRLLSALHPAGVRDERAGGGGGSAQPAQQRLLRGGDGAAVGGAGWQRRGPHGRQALAGEEGGWAH